MTTMIPLAAGAGAPAAVAPATSYRGPAGSLRRRLTAVADGFAILLRDAPPSKRGGEMPALMYDLADRVGGIFSEQFRKAGYDANAAPIYAHALVGMVAFVGQWWTEARKPPAAEAVASHIAALAWMGLRHLPKRPAPLDVRAKQPPES